jgi:hypothetical protein
MPRFALWQASFVFLLLGVSSCQRRQVTVPVPPAPVTSQPASHQPPAPAASNSGASSTETTTQPEAPGNYQVNKPAPAAKKPARPAASPAPAAASTGTTTPAASTPTTAPVTPAPKLGDILTPDEQKQYSASIDQSLSRAQSSLNSIAGRQLNKDQQAQVEQIRNFMEQARATRSSDAAGAKSLAERAEVLARDLAAVFR